MTKVRITDLDMETKSLIFWAGQMARRPNDQDVLKRLQTSYEVWDRAHEHELVENLMAAMEHILTHCWNCEKYVGEVKVCPYCGEEQESE